MGSNPTLSAAPGPERGLFCLCELQDVVAHVDETWKIRYINWVLRRARVASPGEMTEWPKVRDWKSRVLLTGYQGFESLSLRNFDDGAHVVGT